MAVYLRHRRTSKGSLITTSTSRPCLNSKEAVRPSTLSTPECYHVLPGHDQAILCKGQESRLSLQIPPTFQVLQRNFRNHHVDTKVSDYVSEGSGLMDGFDGEDERSQ